MAEGRRGRFERYVRFAMIAVEAAAQRMAGQYSRTEGAHLLVRDAEGRVLVVRPTYAPRAWQLPGGRVERGETPHAAAERETAEETGISATARRLLVVDARRSRDVSFIFEGSLVGGTPMPQPGEIAATAFVARGEIAALSPGLERLLRMVDELGDGPRYLGIP